MIAGGAAFILENAKSIGPIPHWITAPSGFLLFGLILKVFDRWTWKWAPIRLFFGLDTPDLTGSWEGTLTSSFDNHAVKHKALLDIKQSWSRISIKATFEKSKSQSTTAAIVTTGMASPVLIYGFTNRPDADSKLSMHTHSGTAELYFENKGALLGGYFTSRDRQNNGGLTFHRVSK